MDMSAYKETFLAEAREHIDNLNVLLLDLEKNSNDETVINGIFRIFHTLKGNSATMGYNKFSHIAHDLENLLDKIRKHELSINTEITNILFKGLDVLEKGLEFITNDQADSLEIQDIIEMINIIIPSEQKQFTDIKITETAHLTGSEEQKVRELEGNGYRIRRAIMQMDPANPLKGGKASLILNNIKSIGEIIVSMPKEENIKTGKFNADFEVIFATKEDKEKISQKINQISGIKNLSLLELNEKYVSPTIISDSSGTQGKSTAQSASQQAQSGEHIVKQVQDVRIDIKRLDYLMNMVGELLINKMRLEQINTRYQIGEMESVIKTIGRLTDDIQNEVITDRMIPVGQIFTRFPRMVRDLSLKQNKKIEFIMEGQDIMLDRTVIDKIGDPLVHILRNSVDHGIELPSERTNNGKQEQGTIKLIAKREKNIVIIEINDDGAGIDTKRVKEVAIKKGHITKEEADKMSEEQLRMLIFHPGTSTNTEVTEVSGRGVGMDVVKTVINSIGGSVKLESELGKGTKLLLQLPLTVSIITVLLVEVGNETYAIPLANVDRTVHVGKQEIKTIQGNKVFLLRQKEVPLISLAEMLGKGSDNNNVNVVVVVEAGVNQCGLIVDRIIAQQQILVKSLDEKVKKTKGMAGATILGDGSVCLILDVASLLT